MSLTEVVRVFQFLLLFPPVSLLFWRSIMDEEQINNLKKYKLIREKFLFLLFLIPACFLIIPTLIGNYIYLIRHTELFGDVVLVGIYALFDIVCFSYFLMYSSEITRVRKMLLRPVAIHKNTTRKRSQEKTAEKPRTG